MKISNIVKVNLNAASHLIPTSSDLNLTAAVIVAISGGDTNDNDVTWRPVSELLDVNTTWVADPTNVHRSALERLSKSFFNNGGINLIAKRIYSGDVESGSTIAQKIVAAVNGSETYEALPMDVINILVIDEAGTVILPTISTVASELVNSSAPEEKKMLYLNVTRTQLGNLSGISTLDNVVVNVYSQKAEGGAPTTNNYEVAMIPAYFSKIKYNSDIIQGLEYTEFVGYDTINKNNLNIEKDLPDSPNAKVNIITPLVNRYLLKEAVTANGDNILGRYFIIVLTQKITTELARLVINKMRFEGTTYSTIQNSLTALLDIFARNRLLDTEYVSDQEYFVTRQTLSGEAVSKTISKGEIFTEGYRIFTLPPSKEDLSSKTYTGVYVYVAIANQISAIEVSGLALGGV